MRFIYMNQTEKYRQTKLKDTLEIIQELTHLSFSLQEKNLTNNAILVTMNLSEWIKNISVKSWEITKFTFEICQYILEKLKNEKQKNKTGERSNKQPTEKTKVDELSIEFLVERIWFMTDLNSADEIQEISSYLKDNFSQLRDKSDNIHYLVSTIIEDTKSNKLLLKLLVEYFKQIEKKIFFNSDEYLLEKKIRGYLLINDWETKLNENYYQGGGLTDLQKEYLEYLRRIKNSFDNSFWLLVSYSHILEGKEIVFVESTNDVQELRNLKLIVEEKNVDTEGSANIWKVTNRLYQELFSLNWVDTKITRSQNNLNSNYPKKPKVILNFLRSDRFKDTIDILNKIGHYSKTIIENTIFWTGEENQFEWSENEQSLTEKIFKFVTKVIDREDELYPKNEDNQEWFNKVMMFSLSWKNIENSITQEEFTKLIATRVSQEEDAPDRIDLRKSLLELASSRSPFTNNPLYVANLILLYTRDSKKVSKIIDYIMDNPNIIKNEEYFKSHTLDDQFYHQVIDASQQLNINQNNQEEYLNMDEMKRILTNRLGQNTVTQYLRAILLYDFTQLELRRERYFSDGPNPEDEDDYKKWIGDGNGGEALTEFRDFLPNIQSTEVFTKDRYTGKLKDTIYEYEKNPSIVKFIAIDGLPHGVYFITKKGTPRGILSDLCQDEIIKIVIKILVGEGKELTL